MTASDGKKLNGQKARPSSQTATEKASALANLKSNLGRPAKSLATLSLGAAASAFLGPGNASATPIAPGPQALLPPPQALNSGSRFMNCTPFCALLGWITLK